MRLQLIREGQIYKTRTGSELLVVNITKDENGNHRVQYELGGVLQSLDILDFRLQVHSLIHQSFILPVFETKEELQKSGFTYNNGDVWIDENNERYMVVRNLRNTNSSVALVNVSGLESYEITNTKAVNLRARVIANKPAKINRVMYKGYVCDVIHTNPHSLDIIQAIEASEEPEDGYNPFALTVGFGNVVSYDANFDDIFGWNEFYGLSELSDMIWLAGTLEDAKVQQKLNELEYIITERRWG